VTRSFALRCHRSSRWILRSRRSLPILFSASGAAAASAALDLWSPGGRGALAAHRFGIIAKVAELAMTFALQREVSIVPRVARPLRTGPSGVLWKSARALTALSLAASLLGGKRRSRRLLAGLLGTAGALALRFGVVLAGRFSARDPHASFQQQRAGQGATEAVRPATGVARALDEAIAQGATS